jgi:predicted nucleotidyltransferase
MAISIDTYLRGLASTYYLKNNSAETAKINSSVRNLFTNLDNHFNSLIIRKFVFGSYDRDTILPRNYDSKSDVDVMIVFNQSQADRTPETYRSWLKTFADKYYNERYGSLVSKSFPTITLKLDHIHYDLVPAKEESSYYGSTIYIPGNNGWRATDPNDVKQKLIVVNTQYSQVVRPIIRLLKAWNCDNGYPYDSYLLELAITSMNFSGDNVQSGFFYAVSQLQTSYGDGQFKGSKIESLKYNINQVVLALDSNDLTKGKQWLHRILPM